MDPFTTLLAILITASVFFGFILGNVNSKIRLAGTIKAAKDQVLEEVEKEKSELAKELGSQMQVIRDSISNSINAYESTLETLEEKLGITEEDQELLKLAAPNAEPIAIEFKETEQAAIAAEKSPVENEAAKELQEQVIEQQQDLDLLEEASTKEKPSALVH